MKIATSYAEAVALGASDIFKDADDRYRCYEPGEIVRPVPAVDTRSDLAKEIDASPALTALANAVAKLEGVTKDALLVALDAEKAK